MLDSSFFAKITELLARFCKFNNVFLLICFTLQSIVENELHRLEVHMFTMLSALGLVLAALYPVVFFPWLNNAFIPGFRSMLSGFCTA